MSDVISREVFERGQAGCRTALRSAARRGRPDPPVPRRRLCRRAVIPGSGRPSPGSSRRTRRPRSMIRREAVEEAGLEVGELLPIQSVMLTPGACSETCQIFLGRVDTSNAGGVFGLASEGEDILVKVMPFAEALRPARAQRGRQRRRRDRPAVARPASRRGAQALALIRRALRHPKRTLPSRPGRSAGTEERDRYECPVGFHRQHRQYAADQAEARRRTRPAARSTARRSSSIPAAR